MKVMPGANFFGWLLLTTFPDIMIAVADFLTGLALYRAILAEKVTLILGEGRDFIPALPQAPHPTRIGRGDPTGRPFFLLIPRCAQTGDFSVAAGFRLRWHRLKICATNYYFFDGNLVLRDWGRERLLTKSPSPPP